jgi:thiol:disulfide interchange protein DsbC
VKKILLSAALIASITAYAKPAEPIKIDELQKMNFFKNKDIKIMGTSIVEGTDLTLVSFVAQTPQGGQKMNAFIPSGKKYVIVGGGYKDQNGEQLMVPMDMSVYKKDAGITIGTGKKELYVFTDPECPYCMKMDKEVLSSLPMSEYTVRVFMFPLSFHKNAESMSMYILSQKTPADKFKALHDISNGSKDYMSASYTEAERVKLKGSISKQMGVAQALGVSGTPTVFDERGAPINWMSLGAAKHQKQ